MKRAIILTALLIFSTISIFSIPREETMNNNHVKLNTIRLIKKMYNGNPDLADHIFHKECIHHVNGVTEEGKGPEAIKKSLTQMGIQFKQSKTVFTEIFGSGNSVAVRWTWTAVQIQSGKKWTFNGNSIFHLKDGKVVEYWAIDDRLREMTTHGFTIAPPQK